MSKALNLETVIPIIGPILTNLLNLANTILKRGSKLDLFSHPLFLRVRLNKTNIKSYFVLENKGKEIVFKDILCQHMDIYNKYAKILCDKYISKEIDDEDTLYSESVSALDGILTDLRTFYVSDERYSYQEKKALDIVMSKYNHWNQERQTDMTNRMLEICNSAFYPSLNNKMVAILDSLMFAMNDTVSDANKTLNNINGDLKGLVFKGVII